jgi:hypothetical protein
MESFNNDTAIFGGAPIPGELEAAQSKHIPQTPASRVGERGSC